jgi:hypothetical protein
MQERTTIHLNQRHCVPPSGFFAKSRRGECPFPYPAAALPPTAIAYLCLTLADATGTFRPLTLPYPASRG